jgi:hypothetical protein
METSETYSEFYEMLVGILVQLTSEQFEDVVLALRVPDDELLLENKSTKLRADALIRWAEKNNQQDTLQAVLNYAIEILSLPKTSASKVPNPKERVGRLPVWFVVILAVVIAIISSGIVVYLTNRSSARFRRDVLNATDNVLNNCGVSAGEIPDDVLLRLQLAERRCGARRAMLPPNPPDAGPQRPPQNDRQMVLIFDRVSLSFGIPEEVDNRGVKHRGGSIRRAREGDFEFDLIDLDTTRTQSTFAGTCWELADDIAVEDESSFDFFLRTDTTGAYQFKFECRDEKACSAFIFHQLSADTEWNSVKILGSQIKRDVRAHLARICFIIDRNNEGSPTAARLGLQSVVLR